MIYVREFFAGLISPCVVLSRHRFSRQLLKFAHTELYTFYDIGTVAERQQEDAVREEMRRHAGDEYRHYKIFKEWAVRVSPYSVANYTDPDGPEDATTLDEPAVCLTASQEAAPNRRFETLGEYMLYLFLSESRAVVQFRLYRFLNPWSKGCRRQIPVVLADEGRHVRYSLRYSWRELRRAPWTFAKGSVRVAGYILRQDLVDLLKLVQTVGSGAVSAVLYGLVVTPYALCMRALGALRRRRLRNWKEAGEAALDDEFWSRAG